MTLLFLYVLYLPSFLACVEEFISERESRRFEEGLNTKVKLDIYKRFGKNVYRI